MQNLVIADKFTVFKTIEISKIVHFGFIKVDPNSII